MNFSLNSVNLMGKLGKDAETSSLSNDVTVTKFSMATEHSRKDKDGNWQNYTTWHNIVAFNLNDYLKDRLKKGNQFHVTGRIENRSYEKDGVTKYVSEVVADYNAIIPGAVAGNGNRTTAPEPTHDAPEASGSENDDLPF